MVYEITVPDYQRIIKKEQKKTLLEQLKAILWGRNKTPDFEDGEPTDEPDEEGYRVNYPAYNRVH
ncbi:MAG TPA: hypothetical protein VHE53_00820 [Patescibacteria group bacterium]|nr:hypothetical protein [Patescibacteria group bacterium]